MTPDRCESCGERDVDTCACTNCGAFICDFCLTEGYCDECFESLELVVSADPDQRYEESLDD